MLKKIILFCLIGYPIIWIPAFNDFPLIENIAFLRSPSVYLLMPIPLLLILILKKLNRFDIKILFLITIFIIFTFFSFIINYMYGNYDGKVEIALRYYIINILLIIFLTTISFSYILLSKYYNFIYVKNYIYKYSFYSIYILFIYSFIVFMSYRSAASYSIYEYLESIFHSRPNDYYDENRFRGLAFEPSYLSLPLTFLFPIIYSKFLVSHRAIDLLTAIGIFIISLYSGSKIGIVVLLSQLFIFLIISNVNLKIKILIFILPLVSVYIYIDSIIDTFFSFGPSDISNLERYGTVFAALKLIWDNPIFGVGLGLGGGFLGRYYPDFFYLSYTALSWINVEDFKGTFFSYPLRIVAEVGLIGSGILLLIYLTLLNKLLKILRLLKNIKNPENEYFVKSLLVIFLTLPLNSLAIDNYTFIGFWCIFGFIIMLEKYFSIGRLSQ